VSSIWIRVALGTLACVGLAGTGCVSSQPTFTGASAVFYCGGAGEDGVLANWGRGVKEGLLAAGYTGTFEEYHWETGLGVIADQEENVKAKRARATKMAQQIVAYESQCPDSPVTLMGLSAGTAIVIYALEALPAANQVDTVVMLSSSVSADYDLTQALRHVRGDMYVTTAPNDAVLADLAPAFGTADRKYVGREIAGLEGFRMPPDADLETRRLYAKIMNLAWDPVLDQFGDYGGHTDTAKPGFVQHVIAPLVMREGPRTVRIHANGTAGTYQRASE
jgi:pimeloyl-ACP methyl ester carboxylesterase